MHTLQFRFTQGDGPFANLSARLLTGDVLIDETGPYEIDLAVPRTLRPSLLGILKSFLKKTVERPISERSAPSVLSRSGARTFSVRPYRQKLLVECGSLRRPL